VVGPLGRFGVVSGHDDDRPFVGGLSKQAQGVVAVEMAEVGRGFVGEQYGWPRGESTGDGDPLLLSAGELVDEVVAGFAEADEVESLSGSSCCGG